MNSKPVQVLGAHNSRSGRRLCIAMVVLCAIGAAAVIRRVVVLGTAAAGSPHFAGLDASFAAKAGMTLLHIVPSLLFVLLVPLQFVPSWRRSHPWLHRWAGRAVMSLGL